MREAPTAALGTIWDAAGGTDRSEQLKQLRMLAELNDEDILRWAADRIEALEAALAAERDAHRGDRLVRVHISAELAPMRAVHGKRVAALRERARAQATKLAWFRRFG